MVYDFEGVVHEVGQTLQVSANFQKRALVFLDRTNYGDRFVSFEFQQAKCAELDAIQPGQRVKVAFVLDGARQAYNGRYFTTVKGIKIEALTAAAPAPAGAPTAATTTAAPTAAPASGGAVVHLAECELKIALDEFVAWKGNDPAAFAQFAKDTCPDVRDRATATGQKFTAIATPKDWAKVVNRIRDTRAYEAGQISSQSLVPDDIPF